MRKSLIVCGAGGLLISASAQAEWLKVSTSMNNSAWYMDAERVKVVGDKVQAWVKIDSSHDRTVKWSESKQLLSFDCAGEKYKTLSVVTYDSYGKIIWSRNIPDYGYGIGYEPIVPDSMVEAAEKLACIASPRKE